MFSLLKKTGCVLLIVALFASLSSCGRRGALEAPNAGTASEVQGEEAPKPETPDREFILDSLI